MNNLHFRPARADDEAAVSTLSAHIWEGEDYVPRQFANWLNDPHGQFTVVYEGEQLVAFGKLTRLGADEWWLEGLRVHPEHRGRGIARRLHYYAVDMADRIGKGTLRFATNRENRAVHKLAQETGFELVGNYMLCDTEPVSANSAAGSFAAVSSKELGALEQWLRKSACFKAWSGLYEERWKWYAFQPRLVDLVTERRIYWWQLSAQNTQGVVVVSDVQNGTFGVNYLDAVPSAMKLLAAELRQPGVFGQVEKLRLKPPSESNLRIALEATGWQIEEYEMSVFERKLAATHSNSS